MGAEVKENYKRDLYVWEERWGTNTQKTCIYKRRGKRKVQKRHLYMGAEVTENCKKRPVYMGGKVTCRYNVTWAYAARSLTWQPSQMCQKRPTYMKGEWQKRPIYMGGEVTCRCNVTWACTARILIWQPLQICHHNKFYSFYKIRSGDSWNLLVLRTLTHWYKSFYFVNFTESCGFNFVCFSPLRIVSCLRIHGSIHEKRNKKDWIAWKETYIYEKEL